MSHSYIVMHTYMYIAATVFCMPKYVMLNVQSNRRKQKRNFISIFLLNSQSALNYVATS